MKTVASGSNFLTVKVSDENKYCSFIFRSAPTCRRKGLNGCEWHKTPKKKMISIDLVTRRPIIVARAVRAQMTRSTSDHEVLKNARKKFCELVSFRVEDKDVSLGKVMLVIAAEDEALISFNREMDARAVLNEGRETSSSSKVTYEWGSLDTLPLAGRSITDWLFELDVIAKQVEAELVSKDIGCHLAEVLEAVNVVLFDLRGFTRPVILKDPTQSYLHTVLKTATGSGIILSIIYIEVCRRLGVTIVGAGVGEDFLIWPQTENTEDLFRLSEGESWFAKVNGNCVKHPGSKAFDLNSRSLPSIKLGSNRDIIGIALANLKRLYWKRASRAHPGLLLTSPLRPVHHTSEKQNNVDSPNVLTVRPQELSKCWREIFEQRRFCWRCALIYHRCKSGNVCFGKWEGLLIYF